MQLFYPGYNYFAENLQKFLNKIREKLFSHIIKIKAKYFRDFQSINSENIIIK